MNEEKNIKHPIESDYNQYQCARCIHKDVCKLETEYKDAIELIRIISSERINTSLFDVKIDCNKYEYCSRYHHG